MRHWMYNLYAEKDKMLEKFYQSGTFPHDMYPPASTSTASVQQSREPKMLYHDPMKFVFLHLFFLASSFVMYLSFNYVKSIWWWIYINMSYAVNCTLWYGSTYIRHGHPPPSILMAFYTAKLNSPIPQFCLNIYIHYTHTAPFKLNPCTRTTIQCTIHLLPTPLPNLRKH